MERTPPPPPSSVDLDTTGGTSVIRRIVTEPPRRTMRSFLLGRPLASAEAEHETIGRTVGLAVFASDALSSTAYATQEMMLILAVAGAAAFVHAWPLSIAIVVLLAIVSTSYWQTIHAYPGGGGAYIVSRQNLGPLPAQVAGAALLTDYILTVAVSISSAVAQIGSAYEPARQHRVLLAVLLVVGMTVVNLRGVRESGRVLAVPTYFFIVMIVSTCAAGLWRHLQGTLGAVPDPPPLEDHAPLAAVTLFLLLHAFSSGTTALTGLEAISNGVTAFREPRSRNAGLTLLTLAGILGVLFLSITFLGIHVHAVPSEHGETVVSQIARASWGGRGLPYLMMMAGTAIILILAANTAYAGFPRLSAIQADDGFLPRQLTFRGSRLVYSWGILTLAGTAILLIIAFRASVTALIPLYAIGVFLSFTLSQFGMALHWRRCGRLPPGDPAPGHGDALRHDRLWAVKMGINALGAFLTGLVTIVFAVTKFTHGAWIVVLLIPALVWLFFRIHRHYTDLGRRLAVEEFGTPPRLARNRVLLLVSGVHRGTLEALRYARMLGDDITALHVAVDPEEGKALREKWDRWGEGVRLVILDSPYRLLWEPLLRHVDELSRVRQPNETITILVPQFVPSRWWHNLLHSQTALTLRMQFLFRTGIIVTDVPYHVDSHGPGSMEHS